MEGRGKENARRLRTSPKPRIGQQRPKVEDLARAGKRRETEAARGSRMRTRSTAQGALEEKLPRWCVERVP